MLTEPLGVIICLSSWRLLDDLLAPLGSKVHEPLVIKEWKNRYIDLSPRFFFPFSFSTFQRSQDIHTYEIPRRAVRGTLIAFGGLLLAAALTNSSSSPIPLPCSAVEVPGDQSVVVPMEAVSMEGCKLTDTNLTLIVMDPGPSALPPFTTMIRLGNISALRSSVVVQTRSSANSSDVFPLVGIGGDLSVEVSNCTLVDGVDAFVVDVHNATMWAVINISVQDRRERAPRLCLKEVSL